MAETARRAFVATLVSVSVIVLALVLWKIRLVLGLVFTGFIIAAAIRPSIDRLHRLGVPRVVGLMLHYLLFAGILALLLWVAVPRALHQVTAAVDNLPQTRQHLRHEANQSTGIKRDVLLALQRRLKELPQGHQLVRPAAEIGKTAAEVMVGIFFVFAVAGYWIFERKRAESVLAALVPRKHRRVVVDTWELIDLRLGAFVRGEGLVVLIAATLLSVLFWAIGLPYWLLIGPFGGIVEIVPVVGPLAAGALAVGVGFTQSVHLAVIAAIVVGGVRLAQDYLINPRVMGGAVGISPLVILINASAVVFLFGGFAVLLAVPIAAVLVTLIDVIVRDKDPAEEETPTVLFPAKEAER
jgi:predicted PurR-regulated permease PerM